MKIHFSPSESKSNISEYKCLDENSFIFKELFSKRMEVVKRYNDFIFKSDINELAKLFGIKDKKEIESYINNILQLPTCTAVKLYSGVSYSYLNFESLDNKAKEYILSNVLIFSNLFGPVLASDKLPYYKFKQGEKIDGFVVEKYYKDNFSTALDEYLKDEEILDLRAGFYEKFYNIPYKYSTYKFIKNGKVVSHFAKAYRGILLKYIAENNISTNNDLLNNLPENIKYISENTKGNKTEYTVEVGDI